jgi:hypothetical protein
MSGRDDHDDEPLIPEASEPTDELGWTEEIRRLRRTRADRLKELFDTFEHDEGEEAPPE